MKHTPAPWIIYQPDKFVLAYSFQISEMTKGKAISITNEEAEANRVLMQAAPELLEVAEILFECFNENTISSQSEKREALKKANLVIIKAKGL